MMAARGWLLLATRRAALKGAPLPLRARARGGDRLPYDGRYGEPPGRTAYGGLNERILGSGVMEPKRFFALDSRVYEDGALPAKTKELFITHPREAHTVGRELEP